MIGKIKISGKKHGVIFGGIHSWGVPMAAC
jgi:hypothetical protein